MVIKKCPVDEIPEGAIKLSDSEAIREIWKEINNWKHGFDVAAFTYGPGILSAVSGVSLYMYYVNARRHFKLGHYMRLNMAAASIVAPCLFSAVLHMKFITNDIVLQKPCPMCVYTKALVLQNLFGVGYGLTTPYILGIYAANCYATVERLPRFDDLWAVYKLWKKYCRRIFPMTFFFVGINVICTTLFTLWEYISFSRFYEKWIESQITREIDLDKLSKMSKLSE